MWYYVHSGRLEANSSPPTFPIFDICHVLTSGTCAPVDPFASSSSNEKCLLLLHWPNSKWGPSSCFFESITMLLILLTRIK